MKKGLTAFIFVFGYDLYVMRLRLTKNICANKYK